MLTLASRKLNGILADEMGLGKTLQARPPPPEPRTRRLRRTHAFPPAPQTISVLGVTTLELLEKKPHLVIVPLSVLGNWQREFAKWCPALKVVKLHGDKEARQHAVQQELRPGSFNVCVTTCAAAVEPPAGRALPACLPLAACPRPRSARRAARPAFCPPPCPAMPCPGHPPSLPCLALSRQVRGARPRGGPAA